MAQSKALLTGLAWGGGGGASSRCLSCSPYNHIFFRACMCRALYYEFKCPCKKVPFENDYVLPLPLQASTFQEIQMLT